MSDQNKTLVKRFYNELVNQGNLGLVDELMSGDYVEHGNPSNSGIEGFRNFAKKLVAAFPDLQVTIEDLIAEGDKVVARVVVRGTHLGTLMGTIHPTGRQVTFSGVDIFQINDGKIIGRWNQRDLLGLMRQLDADNQPG